MNTYGIDSKNAARMLEILIPLRQKDGGIPQITAIMDPIIDKLEARPAVLTADDVVKVRPLMVRYLDFLNRDGLERNSGFSEVGARLQLVGRIRAMKEVIDELPDLPSQTPPPGRSRAS